MLRKFRRFEFEYRIFISLSLVLIICLLAFFVYPDAPKVMVILGRKAGITDNLSNKVGFIIVSIIMLLASLLRMWAGTVLSPPQVMSFKIQKEILSDEGPYQLSRNPIYLADLTCFCAFSLCLPLVGLALPVLLFLHYLQLISYEEENLSKQFGEIFEDYKKRTPRFLPSYHSIGNWIQNLRSFRISRDGFRHNAQYVLLIPGFLVSAFSGNLLHAILIGIPGILDWAIIHTKIGLNPVSKRNSINRKENALAKSKVFKDIIYAQCWEDPEMDREAFQYKTDQVVFSITSGGCNTLTFLLDNPRKIYALDISPYQNYLFELKMAAFKILSHQEVLEFFGVLPCDNRMRYYHILQKDLTPHSQLFWNKQQTKISEGIIHCGRYEAYLRLLRKGLRLIVSKSLPEALFDCKNIEERRELYRKRWNNWRWKIFTKIFLSRLVMTALFTGEFFRQLDSKFSFGDHFRGKIKRALIELPLRGNYFLSYILLGRYDNADILPDYLRLENFETIRGGLDTIEIITANPRDFFKDLPLNSIDCFNCSNIFEWMNVEEFHNLLKEIVRVGKNGAILTYRNLLVPRSRPESLSEMIAPNTHLANQLLKKDRSFIYRSYHVEKITKKDAI